ncbi:amidohydrolase family protein [Dyella amyloliquefaciens]|uniref:amidohydrolase family protein n=1 Tax=Dyella amyloliquefaciens TaxID=1770545 RepID=UPI00102E586F|nr:amidohydrolase family protein [Dyella amyloliquefaciens]
MSSLKTDRRGCPVTPHRRSLGLLCAASLSAFAGVPAAQAQALKPTADNKAFVSYAQPVIAFTHATIVDGTGGKRRRDQTLVSDHGRITAMGPTGKLRLPDGATVIDATGKTLLPGFVMLHQHMFYPVGEGAYSEMSYSFPRLYLAGGVTTMRTGGSMEPYSDLNIRDAISRGDIVGPDMDVTGPYLNGAGLPIFVPAMHTLTGPDDAERTVNYWSDEGATSFKAYMNITHAELQTAIDTAHKRGHKVTGHLCSVTYQEAADLGIDNIEHGFFLPTDFVKDKKPDTCPSTGDLRQSLAGLDVQSKEVKAFLKDLIDHHVAITSTLPVFESTVQGRPEAPSGALDMLAPAVREQYEATWKKIQSHGESVGNYKKLAGLEKQFVEAGGQLLAGTDPTGYGGVVPGFAEKREVELLVEDAGFNFPEAVKIATYNGAQFLGRADDVGSLAVGKRSDILVIDGDASRDPTAIEHMPLVFKNGIGYNTQAIFDAMKQDVGLH